MAISDQDCEFLKDLLERPDEKCGDAVAELVVAVLRHEHRHRLADLLEQKRDTPPPCNTGGASSAEGGEEVRGAAPEEGFRTKVDTVSWTTATPVKLLHEFAEFIVPGARVEGGAAPRGYEAGARILVGDQLVGWTGFGAMHGRSMMYLDGAGCRAVGAGMGFVELQPHLNALDRLRVTRIDIALDTFQGEIGTSTIVEAYAGTGFRAGKTSKNPMLRTQATLNSEGENMGETYYIGAPKATKIARCYEKGLQLFGKVPASTISRAAAEGVLRGIRGDALRAEHGDDWMSKLDSWYRVEIQYRHDRDRPLAKDGEDFDMFTDRDRYFAGAYPICRAFLGSTDGRRPDYVIDERDAALLVQLRACRDSYGGLFATMRELGLSDSSIVRLVMGDRPSKKLAEAGISRLSAPTPYSRPSDPMALMRKIAEAAAGRTAASLH